MRNRTRFFVREQLVRPIYPHIRQGLIGRPGFCVEPEISIMLDDSRVCAVHAQWRWSKGGDLELRDLGSEHGTELNGALLPAKQWARIIPGSLVDFGRIGKPWEVCGSEGAGCENPGDVAGHTHFRFQAFRSNVELLIERDRAVIKRVRGLKADILYALARQLDADDAAGCAVEDKGWITREEWFEMVKGSTRCYSPNVVSNWLTRLSACLGSQFEDCIQVYRGTRGAPGLVRLQPPRAGVRMPEGNLLGTMR